MELLCDRTSSGNKDTATPRVNLFGFDSHEKFPEGGLKEITRLLKLCGIEVHTAVGINCPVSDFRTIGEADANIICFICFIPLILLKLSNSPVNYPLPCGTVVPMEVASNSRDSYPFLTKKSGCPYQLRHIHLCHYPFDRNTFRVQFVESIHFWG